MYASLKRVKVFLPERLSLSSQKCGLRIRDPRKTFPGSRGHKSTGSWIQIHSAVKDVIDESMLNRIHRPTLAENAEEKVSFLALS
jgi:hypothetical protein